MKIIRTFAAQYKGGDVAQLVEQRTENPCVTGSIPVVATLSTSFDVLFFLQKSLQTRSLFGILSTFVDMIDRFKNFIQQQHLFAAEDTILLAVSGGVDSMVMVDLFHQAGYPFAIAHCNFSLRDAESDEDELSVRTIAKEKYGAECFCKRFDTKSYAKQQKLSIQEAARALRYEWFELLRSQHPFTAIATAHHKDDQIETFFINLLRGTGISGLTGIPQQQNHIIRPLLFASRSEIEAFANENKIAFRNDSSNADNKYLRNKIRHQLLPLLEELNPHFTATLQQTIGNLHHTERIYREFLALQNPLVESHDGVVKISISELKKLQPCAHYLYEYIARFGFNAAQCQDICTVMESNSGKEFFSATNRLLIDRQCLFIEPLAASPTLQHYSIEEHEKSIMLPLNLQLSHHKKTEKTLLKLDKDCGSFDRDKLIFPLSLRRWKQGDYFYPLGMKSRKKLSDFFIDTKIPRTEKSKIWLLCSDDKIVWVVGHRIDERFKVDEGTRRIYKVVVSG